MHTIQDFITLFNEETRLAPAFNIAATNIKAIQEGFKNIAVASGFPFGDISLAYVAGSYSRGQQTPHSDIDIECYSDKIDREYQSTFKWEGHLISFSVYPSGTVRGEPDNLIDRSWARSCYKSAKVIYDPEGRFPALVAAYTASEDIDEGKIPDGLWKTLRKILEYKRKLLSAIESNDKVMQCFAATHFLESYVVARNILTAAEISSEKGQFDLLSSLSDESGEKFRTKAERLFSPLTIQECLELTRPFFDDVVKVLKGVSPHSKNTPKTSVFRR